MNTTNNKHSSWSCALRDIFSNNRVFANAQNQKSRRIAIVTKIVEHYVNMEFGGKYYFILLHNF